MCFPILFCLGKTSECFPNLFQIWTRKTSENAFQSFYTRAKNGKTGVEKKHGGGKRKILLADVIMTQPIFLASHPISSFFFEKCSLSSFNCFQVPQSFENTPKDGRYVWKQALMGSSLLKRPNVKFLIFFNSFRISEDSIPYVLWFRKIGFHCLFWHISKDLYQNVQSKIPSCIFKVLISCSHLLLVNLQACATTI
jgi:hypothetical protein